MSDLKNIGRKLKALREISGLNQSDVAAFLDRDRSAISMIESDYIRLPEKEEKRLIAYLENKAKARLAELKPLLEGAIAG